MTVALCLITWNELEGCKHDVPLIDRTKFDEIYCIDGGISDGRTRDSGLPTDGKRIESGV